jgi:hypothetical protein
MKALFILLMCGGALEASSPDFSRLPHYLGKNQCEPFSLEAESMLTTRGIPCRRIFYKWSAGGERGYHAAVLFKVGTQVYFMDNGRQGARKVAADTDWGCVLHIMSGDAIVRMTNDDGSYRKPQKLEEIFR